MQRGDVQVTLDQRMFSRRGILIGLLALALGGATALALVPAPAGADPEFDNGCEVVLTAEEGASGPQAAELTWDCANFEVQKILIFSESGKQFLAGPFDTEGGGLCTPATEPGTSATCRYPGAEAGVIPISALDVCGTEDNDPLVLRVELYESITLQGESAFPDDVQVQCTAPPNGTTTGQTTTGQTTTGQTTTGQTTTGQTATGPTTTTTPAGAGTTGTSDSGQFPKGGVQSGLGGSA